MKQAQSKRAVIVGTFILIGILIFITAVLTLGGQKNTFQETFILKALFKDIGGLQAGNNVWFAGVKIGTVKKITIISDDQVEVVMHIEKSSQRFIHSNAKAKIASDGLIGNKIVVIYGGTSGTPPVTPGNVLDAQKSLRTDELFNTLQENNQNLVAITNNFKKISDQIAEGRGTLGKLLTDESLANQLNISSVTLQATIVEARAFTADLARYASKIETKGSLTNEIVTDTTIYTTLKTTVSKMQDVSSTANIIADNLKNASAQLNESKGTAGALLNDTAIVSSLKIILKNLESSTQKLDENMEALQHHFLLRGYFRRKGKAAAKQDADTGQTGSASQ